MSPTQVQRLNALLQRVQRKRQEPRLVSVAVAAPSANTNRAHEAVRPEPPKLAEAPRPRVSIEDAIAPRTMSSMPPAPLSSVPPPSSMPPPASAPLPVALHTPSSPKAPSSTVPPAEQRATTEVLPAAELPATSGVRVASSPAQPFDSAVRVTSSPRIEAPKSFGDLLELSLALRPKAG